MVSEITQYELNEKLLKANILFLVECYILDSTGSYLMELSLDDIKKRYPEKVEAFKIEVTKNDSLIKKYNIFSYPTLLFFKNNELIDVSNGPLPINEISSKIIRFIE